MAISSTRSKLARKYAPRRFGRGRRVRGRAKEFERILFIAGVALVLVLFLKLLTGMIFKSGNTSIKLSDVEALRIPIASVQTLDTLSGKYDIPLADLLTVYSLENNFFPEKNPDIDTTAIETQFVAHFSTVKAKYSSSALKPFEDLFGSITGEIKYFPVRWDPGGADCPYAYSDSWGAASSDDGAKTHQGCDILDRDNIRGRLQVVSMTDGTVTACGWDNTCGYYVGITAESGNYYYYAHLDHFAAGVAQGVEVTAGGLLGYMGDTGSGKEGTTGKYLVHLHVGISPSAKITSKKYWINPYPFLRLAEMQENND